MSSMNGVHAIIVTYNRKHKLVECLRRVRALSVPPDHVLVVDNASTDGTSDLVREQFPEYEVLTLTQNVGGAGGFTAGMRQALARGAQYVWLFDDDAYAEPDCLGRLLDTAQDADVAVAIQIDQAGRRYGVYAWEGRVVEIDKDAAPVFPIDVFAFVGPLISRRVVEAVGLPREDFFICADDLEYSIRVKSAGFRALCDARAIFWHDYGGQTVRARRFGLTSVRRTDPAWKNYYNMRNEIFIAKNMARGQRERYLAYLLKKHVRLSIGEAIFDGQFWPKWKYTLLGARDGLLGRSGKRVLPQVIK